MSDEVTTRWTDIHVPEGDVFVIQAGEFQGITLWLGDGAVMTVGDSALPSFGDGDRFKPIARAVVVARLRAVADLIERNATQEASR